MQVKAQNPILFLNDKTESPYIGIYFALNHLKNLYRQGWLLKGIQPMLCESVAEHTFGVAVLAMLLADHYYPDLDKLKLLQMSLIHDLGEIYAGDFTPDDRIEKNEKFHLEKDSIKRLFKDTPLCEEYLNLWIEYEDGQSPEAQLIHLIDKLEMVYQATIYGFQGEQNLEEFYKPLIENPLFPELIQIYKILKDYVK
jgi:putative hydrolase of HD superfamily